MSHTTNVYRYERCHEKKSSKNTVDEISNELPLREIKNDGEQKHEKRKGYVWISNDATSTRSPTAWTLAQYFLYTPTHPPLAAVCYYKSKFKTRSQSGGSQGICFALRLYYTCTTGANFKPGASWEDPRGANITTEAANYNKNLDEEKEKIYIPNALTRHVKD